MKILAIDTATEACSVALSIGASMIARWAVPGRGHATLLLPMVDEVLSEAGLPGLRALDAIAFGRGPGGFTGVRIATAVAQGLALGADLPVIPVSDLAALGLQALDRCRDRWPDAEQMDVAVALDARMGEVYFARVRADGNGGVQCVAEQVVAPERLSPIDLPLGLRVGAGHGFGAHPSLADRLGGGFREVWPELLPRAHEIARLARADWQAGAAIDPADAHPVYLRDDVATRSGAPRA